MSRQLSKVHKDLLVEVLKKERDSSPDISSQDRPLKRRKKSNKDSEAPINNAVNLRLPKVANQPNNVKRPNFNTERATGVSGRSKANRENIKLGLNRDAPIALSSSEESENEVVEKINNSRNNSILISGKDGLVAGNSTQTKRSKSDKNNPFRPQTADAKLKLESSSRQYNPSNPVDVIELSDDDDDDDDEFDAFNFDGDKNEESKSTVLPDSASNDWIGDTTNNREGDVKLSAEMKSNDVSASNADDSDDESDEIDSDEFEDVSLDVPPDHNFDYHTSNDITVTLNKQPLGKKKQKKKVSVVTGEERIFRRTLHMLCLFAMVGHGVCRNSWCSSVTLLTKLRKSVPKKLLEECSSYRKLQTMPNVTVQTKTRKLLDLLRKLMVYWYDSWMIKSTSPCLYKKSWAEIMDHDKSINSETITRAKFQSMIKNRRGSRDISAQGFVALLRSLGLPARLVFSIQPPDFTNLSIVPNKEDELAKSGGDSSRQSSRSPTPKKLAPKKKPSQHERLLSALRVNRPAYTNFRKDEEEEQEESKYPVFWCEVWDKDSKKFITIDPIVTKYIEMVSSKSKLEPPSTNLRNNAFYVVGFDRLGGARDITRRYSENYNAKVRKKRITRERKGEEWYEALLQGASSKSRIKPNKIDKFEELEFEERSMKEGMPNSIQEFVNHPLYVIEEQLKFNEVLQPKISCGTIRKKTKNGKEGELIPVYKRSNVAIVRSAKAWYMRGRVLKVGERPLKMKPKVKPQKKKPKYEDNFELSDGDDSDEDDDDGDVRLYSEQQTELYVPPAIVNGKLKVNAFGNIDVYEPWMIPDGAVHLEGKHSEKAAKLLGLEYAPAAVGFDFGGSGSTSSKAKGGRGGGRGGGSVATVKIVGIVTLERFKEAIELVSDYLETEEQDAIRRRKELIALRAWKMLLAKLKIRNRLNKEHGGVSESNGVEKGSIDAGNSDEGHGHMEDNDETDIFEDRLDDVDFDDLEEVESDASEEDGSGGGFMIEHDNGESVGDQEGGFLLEDNDEEADAPDEGGGFLLDDVEDQVYENEQGGGFVAEDVNATKIQDDRVDEGSISSENEESGNSGDTKRQKIRNGKSVAKGSATKESKKRTPASSQSPTLRTRSISKTSRSAESVLNDPRNYGDVEIPGELVFVPEFGVKRAHRTRSRFGDGGALKPIELKESDLETGESSGDDSDSSTGNEKAKPLVSESEKDSLKKEKTLGVSDEISKKVDLTSDSDNDLEVIEQRDLVSPSFDDRKAKEMKRNLDRRERVLQRMIEEAKLASLKDLQLLNGNIATEKELPTSHEVYEISDTEQDEQSKKISSHREHDLQDEDDEDDRDEEFPSDGSGNSDYDAEGYEFDYSDSE